MTQENQEQQTNSLYTDSVTYNIRLLDLDFKSQCYLHGDIFHYIKSIINNNKHAKYKHQQLLKDYNQKKKRNNSHFNIILV